MNKEIKCDSCDTDLTQEEIAHDALYSALHGIMALAALTKLPVAHTIHVALDYFMEQSYECAPDNEDAEDMIIETFNRKKEEKNGPTVN